MSVEIMGKVWAMAIPHQQKMVLLALADHADHEGKHIYPSLGLIAWKTDYSLRQVRRIMRDLEEQKILHQRQSRPGKSSFYEIYPDRAPQKPPYRKMLASNLGHDDLGSGDLGSGDLGHGVLDPGHLEPPSLLLPPIPPNNNSSPETIREPSTTPPSPSRGRASVQAGFDEFWQAYPRKKSKGQAERAWAVLHPDLTLRQRILAALVEARRSPEWLRERGKYIPYPASWLNAKGWEDEFPAAEEPSTIWTEDLNETE